MKKWVKCNLDTNEMLKGCVGRVPFRLPPPILYLDLDGFDFCFTFWTQFIRSIHNLDKCLRNSLGNKTHMYRLQSGYSCSINKGCHIGKVHRKVWRLVAVASALFYDQFEQLSAYHTELIQLVATIWIAFTVNGTITSPFYSKGNIENAWIKPIKAKSHRL